MRQLITRQLNTWTFNHVTFHHRPLTGCTLPSFPLKHGITMKRGQGALQEQTQSKVGIVVCKRFIAIIQHCGLFCRESKT